MNMHQAHNLSGYNHWFRIGCPIDLKKFLRTRVLQPVGIHISIYTSRCNRTYKPLEIMSTDHVDYNMFIRSHAVRLIPLSQARLYVVDALVWWVDFGRRRVLAAHRPVAFRWPSCGGEASA